MKLIKADYIVPINKSPINDGYILFDKDKILYVGKKSRNLRICLSKITIMPLFFLV